MEIVEKHHNKKIDAPSGTALALQTRSTSSWTIPAIINMTGSVRESPGIRKKSEFSLSAAAQRRGARCDFAGTDEVITFNYAAYSKAILPWELFRAAKFLGGKPAGLYSMADVIG